MKPVPSKSARHLAVKSGARMVIVLTFSEESKVGVTSHGRRVTEDEDARRLGDRIAKDLTNGTLASFPRVEPGGDLRSLEGRARKAIELLTEALAGHGGDSCPFGAAPCLRCRLAREWAAYDQVAEETPSGPKRKRCIQDRCRRMAVAPGPYCNPCRQVHRAAAGLEAQS